MNDRGFPFNFKDTSFVTWSTMPGKICSEDHYISQKGRCSAFSQSENCPDQEYEQIAVSMIYFLSEENSFGSKQ